MKTIVTRYLENVGISYKIKNVSGRYILLRMLLKKEG